MIDYEMTCSDPNITDISYSYIEYRTSDGYETLDGYEILDGYETLDEYESI